MLAYHGKPELKKSIVAQMAAHRKADELVQGYGYWEDGKGCAVGCLIKSGNHKEYETSFGIPAQLAQLEDAIFEGLSKKDAQKWPERFLKAIQPGANLSKVWSEFAYWMLVDKEHGVIKYANGDERVINAILGVADLHKKEIDGEAAGAAAWAAAGAAAREAAWAAAGAAAREAARAAAGAAARAAAWAAARAAARAAAGAAAYIRMADKLIELIENAPKGE